MEKLIGSHIGSVRKENEDYALNYENDYFKLMLVADGMGGHKNGKMASNFFSNQVLKELKKLNDLIYSNADIIKIKQAIKKAVLDTNQKLINLQPSEKQSEKMGTTVVGIIIIDEQAFIFNVGDSRCYLLDNENKLMQITTDHKLVNKLLTEKQITKEEASLRSDKNVLHQALGFNKDLDIPVSIHKIRGIKSLLICSDGLTDMVKDYDIFDVLINKDLKIKDKIRNLIDLANNNGGYDNITIGIVEF